MSAASPSGSPQITISPEEHISRCSSVDPDRQPADSRKTGLSVSASASPIAAIALDVLQRNIKLMDMPQLRREGYTPVRDGFSNYLPEAFDCLRI